MRFARGRHVVGHEHGGRRDVDASILALGIGNSIKKRMQPTDDSLDAMEPTPFSSEQAVEAELGEKDHDLVSPDAIS